MRRSSTSWPARTAIVGVLALSFAACGGSGTPDVAGEPAVTPTASPDGPTPGPAAPSPSPAPSPTTPAAEPTENAAPAEPADFTVEPEGQELALVGPSGVEVLYTLPDEGESVFRAAALRPGSTRDDMVVVVVTSAEGMYDLRWLDVTDGEVGELEVFPQEYNLPSDSMSRQELVPVPVWSPDGRSVGWVVPAEDRDAATLRTVGWSDGPGTGDPADDNAAFDLEIGSSQAQALHWTAGEGSRSVLQVMAADGTVFDVHLERQGDGALALLEVTPA
ncbi:MAG: hypothetical protein KY461_11700 [Actinobacteria bacterium]|nr:hypothetical protein [Actinomycetota bacterium]